MTKKQMNKIADEIAKWEMIHCNPKSTKEQLREAEKHIIDISNRIACLPNGMTVMMEIDAIMQNKLKKLKENS